MEQHINRNISLLLFASFIFFTSCSKLTYKKNGFEDTQKLILNRNNSFTEYFQYMNLRDTFYGRWEKFADTIILHIERPIVYYSNQRNEDVEEYKLNSDSITFKVNSYANIFLNQEKLNPLHTDTTGYLKIRNIELKHFIVNTFFDEIDYTVKKSESNFFKIKTINDSRKNNHILRINPITKFLKKKTSLIPIINDSIRIEFKLKRFFLD